MKFSSLKPSDVKSENKAGILRYVYKNGITSKTEICRVLGMSKPTASLLVQELVNEQLLKEVGLGISSNQGGKRPQLYDFNAGAGAVIALFVGLDSLQGALIDLKVNVLYRIHKAVPKGNTDQMLSNMSSMVQQLLDHADKENVRIFGIGVSAPGVIESKRGILVNATHLEGMSEIPIGPHLTRKFALPVWVNNESRNMAIAEKWFGIGKQVENLITLQTKGGLGTGIIINGQMFQGIDNSGGEFGHTSIDLHGPKCRCGNYGCWELYALESAFVQRFTDGITPESSPALWQSVQQGAAVDFETIAGFYRGHDVYTRAQVQSYASYLSAGIINLINVFNPELIIMRGDLMALGNEFLEEINELVKSRALSTPAKRVQIKFSEFTEDTKIIGAATLVIQEIIDGSFSPVS